MSEITYELGKDEEGNTTLILTAGGKDASLALKEFFRLIPRTADYWVVFDGSAVKWCVGK